MEGVGLMCEGIEAGRGILRNDILSMPCKGVPRKEAQRQLAFKLHSWSRIVPFRSTMGTISGLSEKESEKRNGPAPEGLGA